MSDDSENLPVVFTFEILYAIIDLISLIGSIMVFYGCWRNRSTINMALKLILFLTAFNCAISMQDLIGEALTDSDIECQIYSFIRVFASYLSLLWSISMSLIAYMILKDVRRDLTKIFRNVVIVCFSIAFLLSIRPFVGLSSYHYEYIEYPEYELTFCVLYPNSELTTGKTFFIFFFEQVLPYSIGVIFTLLAYLYAKSYFGAEPENNLEKVTNIESLKLLQYPIAQLIIYTPGMFYSMYLILSQATDSLALPLLKNCYSLGGLIAFMIYRKQKKDMSESLLEEIRLSMLGKMDDTLDL